MKFGAAFIARLRRKEEKAFTELYKLTGKTIYNYILNRVGRNADAADDLLSEVFSDAIDYAGTLTPLHNVVGWLMRIAQSKVVDHYRAHRKETVWRTGEQVEALADSKGLGRDPAAGYMERADAAVVGEAFTALKPRDQEVLRRMYLEDQSVRDIACSLGRSEKAIEGMLYRARNEFERKMEMCKKKAGMTVRGIHVS